MNACVDPIVEDLSVVVVIASLGRPELITQMCALMEQQSRAPDLLLFSVVSDADLPPGFRESDTIKVLKGNKGLCAQRNTALDYLADRYDLIVFYDDDFVPAPSSVARIRTFFATHPDVAGATGNVISDGINTAGIGFDEAQDILRRHEERDFSPNCIVMSLVGLYGCNMVYRTAAIGDARFDERLKLYAWQEDVDFAASLRSRGRIVKTFAFSGVHQGVKFGRTPGLKLGYSQVINPSYLARKGTMPRGFALRLIVRNMLANHLKCLKPEPWVDRLGRVKGNWIGLSDLLRGRLTPERIETL
jgi:glycosyltransferase involved in cell wall biosynthesis